MRQLRCVVSLRELWYDYSFVSSQSVRLNSSDVEDWLWTANLLAVSSDSEDLAGVMSVARTVILRLLDSKIFIKEPLVDLKP